MRRIQCLEEKPRNLKGERPRNRLRATVITTRDAATRMGHLGGTLPPPPRPIPFSFPFSPAPSAPSPSGSNDTPHRIHSARLVPTHDLSRIMPELALKRNEIGKLMVSRGKFGPSWNWSSGRPLALTKGAWRMGKRNSIRILLLGDIPTPNLALIWS